MSWKVIDGSSEAAASRPAAPSRRRSSVAVTRPEGGVVEIVVGQGRWWVAGLLRDAGGALLGGLLFGGVAALIMTGVGHTFRRVVDPQHRAIAAVALFGVVLDAWLRVRVRGHAVRTTLRVTGRGLEVTVLGWWGRRTERAWRREEVFEVRPSKGELHVRLARDHPFRLMQFHSKKEVREAAAAVRDALAEVPPVGLPGDVARGGLTYATAGRPYEIEIERTPEGVKVVVPEEGDRAILGFGPWVVGVTVVVSLGAAFWLWPKLLGHGVGFRSGPLMSVVAVYASPAVAVWIVSMFLLRRLRGGLPLIIEVDGRDVRIDHPALPIRRRRWRREEVTDVIVDCSKGKGGEVIEHFVRIRAGERRSVTFCHGRDGIEMRRVVTVLRNALGMAVLADSAFPEDGSAV